MRIIYRPLALLLLGAGIFAGALGTGADISTAGIVTGLTLLAGALLVYLDVLFKTLNGEYLFSIASGLFFGLVAGYFVSALATALGLAFPGSEYVWRLFPLLAFGYVGAQFAHHPGLRIFGGIAGKPADQPIGGRAKILDTSVIIDGRILDIAETRFIEGPLVIPNFVLREIQLISDSPDPIKRNRGRRGLDMLNKLQQRSDIDVKISYLDYTETREVDAKLIKAALELGAKLITNDFNLNKVAELQGVEVLNLNSLTNALKPVVLPGEDILIDIIKEGKDENQGIGYLEDGTMVVVENGGSLVGKNVRVNVTSIIQTAAGKMVFTRATGGGGSSDDDGRDDGREDGRDRNEGRRRGRRNRGGGGGGDRDRGSDDKPQEGGDREAIGGRRRR